MKGIVLSGGSGSRLYPSTVSVSKQLLPIYDKPMIYYSLSVLMLAGINDILIITSRDDIQNYKKLLGNGSNFGLKIKYDFQNNPNGIAEAFIIGEEFIGNDSVCLILGDNLFYGPGFSEKLKNARLYNAGATLFGYRVNDPERFGVVEFDQNNNVINIEEKPKKPKSNYAISGLYFYDNSVVNFAREIKPSKRGELEITDINKLYLNKKTLRVEIFGRGFAWLDTGTNESLVEASQFVRTIEKRQGLKLACLEEIALNNEWITVNKLKKQIKKIGNSDYKRYLDLVLKEKLS